VIPKDDAMKTYSMDLRERVPKDLDGFIATNRMR